MESSSRAGLVGLVIASLAVGTIAGCKEEKKTVPPLPEPTKVEAPQIRIEKYVVTKEDEALGSWGVAQRFFPQDIGGYWAQLQTLNWWDYRNRPGNEHETIENLREGDEVILPDGKYSVYKPKY